MPYRKLLPRRPTTPMVTVYLFHFDKPFGAGRNQAGACGVRHYTGSVRNKTGRGTRPQDVAARTRRYLEHLTCGPRASKLMLNAIAAGCEPVLAAEYHNVPLTEEYRLKNRGGASRWCPLCRRRRAEARAEARDHRKGQLRLALTLPPPGEEQCQHGEEGAARRPRGGACQRPRARRARSSRPSAAR